MYGVRAPLIALGLIVCPPMLLRADDVYKSVDAQGHVVYSDQPGDSVSQSSRVHVEGTPQPPPVLHFCWTNCFTLVWSRGIYTRTDGTDETWTIEHYSFSEFVLHRHDAPVAWNRFSNDVVYRGQITNDRLINVSVNDAPVRDVQMAWGTALGTLPGSNAERDQRLAQLQQAPAAAVSAPAIAGDMRASDAPPSLPDEEPPASPAEGYFWTPGYWAYTGTGYVFHRGYWGPYVGFYGGINYGHGSSGVGFTGGHWDGNHLSAAVIPRPPVANAPPAMAERPSGHSTLGPARAAAASTSTEPAHPGQQAVVSASAPKLTRTSPTKSPSSPKP